jgi:hypothetical protein
LFLFCGWFAGGGAAGDGAAGGCAGGGCCPTGWPCGFWARADVAINRPQRQTNTLFRRIGLSEIMKTRFLSTLRKGSRYNQDHVGSGITRKPIIFKHGRAIPASRFPSARLRAIG